MCTFSQLLDASFRSVTMSVGAVAEMSLCFKQLQYLTKLYPSTKIRSPYSYVCFEIKILRRPRNSVVATATPPQQRTCFHKMLPQHNWTLLVWILRLPSDVASLLYTLSSPCGARIRGQHSHVCTHLGGAQNSPRILDYPFDLAGHKIGRGF